MVLAFPAWLGREKKQKKNLGAIQMENLISFIAKTEK